MIEEFTPSINSIFERAFIESELTNEIDTMSFPEETGSFIHPVSHGLAIKNEIEDAIGDHQQKGVTCKILPIGWLYNGRDEYTEDHKESKTQILDFTITAVDANMKFFGLEMT